jgi:hypothetical protein
MGVKECEREAPTMNLQHCCDIVLRLACLLKSATICRYA